jgi:diguanylate cyclase (GGDEF)-like protein
MLDKNPGPLAEFNPRMSSRNSGNRRSRPQRYPLRPVLSQVKNLPTPQAVAYALRWIYTGIMGPLRARIFYSLDAVEGGASPQVILPALFEGSELGKTLFFTAGVRNQIAAKIKRLSRGEDPESIDKEIPISPSTSVGSPGGSRRQHYEHLSSEEVVRLNLIRSEMLVGAYRGKKKALPIPASRILQEALGLQRNLNNVTRRTIMQADKDTLTGLSNRGYWERQIPYMQKRLLSQGSVGRRSDWILMIDIDHFKKVNDTYGHTPNGDEALWTVAQVITQIVEDRHTVARFGGEEFVIYLFNSGHEGAQKVAEEIRQAVEKTDIEIKEVPGVNSIRVTVSVGGAEMRMLPPSETPGKLTAEGAVEDAMHRADEHLYHAKENGRNRVHIPKTS